MSPPHSKPEKSHGSVLVVDDQDANLEIVGSLLGDAGYQVMRASSGPQAVESALAHHPDLILLDMMMPGMDGFAVCKELKTSPELAPIPVIFVTAAQQRDLLVRAFHEGAVDFIFKPFVPEELLARVATHLSLKLIRDRLERTAREREDLANLVAHDLKNPLSSILFTAQMGADPGSDESEMRRSFELIRISARDALGFIRVYLEQRAHGAVAAVIPSAVLISDTVNTVVEYDMPRMKAQGMRLIVEPIDPEACVHADPMALRNALHNLFTNAMKYAADGGEAELSVRRGAPGFWQLRVSDRGRGIPRDRQQQLFKRFIRLAEHDPSDGLSSGLGLALTKQSIESFGGQLWYEDRPGGGAMFIIELPEAHAC